MANQPLQYESPGESGWTKHEVAVLVVKVLAAYCVLRGLPVVGQLPAFIYYMIYGGQPITIYDVMFWLAPQMVYMGAGIFLWLMSDALARHLLGSGSGTTAEIPTTSELQAAGFAIIGVLVMVWGVIDLAHAAAMWHDPHNILRPAGLGYPQTAGGVVFMGALQLILGLILFLRARGLAMLWHKIRTGGVVPADERPVESSQSERM